MGMKKVGGGLGSATSSWLSAVKRAFIRSKKEDSDNNNNNINNEVKKKRNKRREETGPEHHEQEKKREKRRWIFSKSATQRHCEVSVTKDAEMLNAEQRHAVAVAAAIAATAEAAAATAQAAVEIVRLTSSSSLIREHNAIIVIQTAFRGYLARKALRALKGLVKLQALVRGQNVRKQAKMTLQHMQARVRVQEQMRTQLARLSHEGARRSMFSESNCLWESKHQKDLSERRSTASASRGGSGCFDSWDERSRTLDEIDRMLQSRKEALMKRERALAYAFSQQTQRPGRNTSVGSESEIDGGVKWLDRWMATKQWESSRDSIEKRNNNNVKIVEVDTSRPYSYTMPNTARPQQQVFHQRPMSPHRPASPRQRAHDFTFNHQSPATPSTPKVRPLQVRSASPRYFKEDKSYSTTHTPTFGSAYRFIAEQRDARGGSIASELETLPNYMAATQSAKAKARSQSAPRTRPATPERERSIGSAKKRLSYPVPPEENQPPTCSQNVRSPSFRSYHDFSCGLEQLSNLSSYYTDSLAEEISPCSTTDLRRWLR